MYRRQPILDSTITTNNSYIGETIEKKMRRVLSNKEPISDGAPLVFTERKDGVQPQYDIRTDRFEIAVEAMDKVSKSHKAKREGMHVVKDDDDKTGGKTDKKDGGAEPIQGTVNQ